MNNRVTVNVGRGCSNFNINIVENDIFKISNNPKPERKEREKKKISYWEMERHRKALNAEYMKAKTPEKRQQVNSRLHEVFTAWIYGK
jgi:hypothetical protein